MSQKRSILFVDDDPLIVRGLQRSSEEYRDDWDIFLAISGQDALTILEQHPIDVLITDIRMPVMDGNQLLELVSQRFPGVVRFVLSGSTENFRLLEASRLAHQYIAKPCDMLHLMQITEQSCRIRDLLNDTSLIKVIHSIKQLPSVPTLYTRLVRELESEDPTPKKVADIIAQDTAMTAKILQLVNSAFFGLPGKVSDPQKAVSILGLNTVKALVLSLHIFSEYRMYSNASFSIDRLWKHSLKVSTATRCICRTFGLDTQAQSNAQIVGILHDVGKLVQLSIPNYLHSVKKSHGNILLASEYEVLGASHAEIGAYLLGIWGLPQYIIEAVAYHHSPSKQISPQFNLISALHIANGLCLMSESKKTKDYQSYLDMKYLTDLEVIDRLDEWGNLCIPTATMASE